MTLASKNYPKEMAMTEESPFILSLACSNTLIHLLFLSSTYSTTTILPLFPYIHTTVTPILYPIPFLHNVISAPHRPHTYKDALALPSCSYSL